MTCCKNIKLSLKTHFAFKKAYKFQWKNAHSTVLQNAWSQKKPILSLKNKISYQKNIHFLWKTILDDKKTERTIENQLGALQKIKKSFENAMTCCKNTKLSLKTHFGFKEAYKFQWKKRPQHRLTKCLKPKKQILSLKNKISYQKNNGFHWKTIFDDKKPKAPLKIN